MKLVFFNIFLLLSVHFVSEANSQFSHSIKLKAKRSPLKMSFHSNAPKQEDKKPNFSQVKKSQDNQHKSALEFQRDQLLIGQNSNLMYGGKGVPKINFSNALLQKDNKQIQAKKAQKANQFKKGLDYLKEQNQVNSNDKSIKLIRFGKSKQDAAQALADMAALEQQAAAKDQPPQKAQSQDVSDDWSDEDGAGSSEEDLNPEDLIPDGSDIETPEESPSEESSTEGESESESSDSCSSSDSSDGESSDGESSEQTDAEEAAMMDALSGEASQQKKG